MNSIKSCLILALYLVLAPLSLHAADEPCLKRVFNQYCLGGAAPEGAPRDSESHLTADAQGNIALQIREGRIVAVSRQLQPANWISFTELKVKLVRLYSTAKDVSDFPLYATSRSSKLNAIRAERGYAAARWERLGWAIQLEWRSLDHLTLRYELTTPVGPQAAPIDTLEGL
ncbi:MAG: hypothetical protein ACPGSC_06870 [Granulosicoccaceae bacterium]